MREKSLKTTEDHQFIVVFRLKSFVIIDIFFLDILIFIEIYFYQLIEITVFIFFLFHSPLLFSCYILILNLIFTNLNHQAFTSSYSTIRTITMSLPQDL